MRAFRLLPIIAVLVVCVGCPPFWRSFEFTNADLSQNSRFNDLLEGSPAAPDGAEGEGETREVVEPDVIRRDGNVLYVLNQYRGLTLVDLEAQTILAQVPTYGYPRDLYIAEGRAYVLVAQANEYEVDGDTISFSVASRLFVVDIAEPSKAAILGEFDLNGDLVDSRLVGDVLYAVCAEYQWYWAETDVLKTQTSESWVTSVNIADPEDIYEADEVSFDGLGDVIQATPFAIFVAGYDWNADATMITYVDISDPAGHIEVRGHIRVHGSVADQYKMDAYDGVLRVVSNEWGWGGDRLVYITTIDLADPDALEVLGEFILEDAIGETLFATRFDGPLAYIVTFFVVDPLFVVDLSDPENPVVTGELEVPGWSTHIEPMGDRLIALGVDDTDGRRVSVSMFDVSDPAAPDLIGDRVTFGESWSWSSAYGDVKALTVLDDVIIVPFSGYNSDFGGYDRLQFISYTDSGLEARGYVDLDGQILRSFEYDATYYGVTSEQLATIDGSDLAYPAVTHRLTLAEYVADFLELSPILGVEIVSAYDSGKTLVRTVGIAKGLGEVEAEIGSLSEAHVYGDSIVLVGTDWEPEEYESFYRVAVVDCSVPEAPEVTAALRVDVSPYWGGWWWRDMPGLPLVDVAMDGDTKSMIAPWYWWPYDTGDTTFVLGDVLALRCWDAEYDSTFGDDDAYEGLALVDLTEGTWTTTVGLGYDDIISLDAAGDKLYLGTKQWAGMDPFRSLCAYYLRELDVAELSIGPATNVPGIFVEYDPAADLLVVRDDQWNFEGDVASSLRTLTWDGAAVLELLDDLELPDNVGTVIGRDDRVYIQAYDEGCYLYAATVAPDGDLAMTPGLLVTEQWANILDGQGDDVLMTVGNAIAHYDFSEGGALADLYQTMGYPLSVRFGTDFAFIPLGYAGIAQLPL